MSDLQRRPGSGVSRNARERRAYRLVVVGGSAAALAVVTFVLSLAGIMGGTIPFLALLVAIVCGLWFRRTVSS